MTTKKKLLNKICELERKQELLERKIEFLFNKDDGKAGLSIDRDVELWQKKVCVYYMFYGEVKCVEIRTFSENAKIVSEDNASIVVCLSNSTGKKTYALISKPAGNVVAAPEGFSFEKEEKEEKEGKEEKAND